MKNVSHFGEGGEECFSSALSRGAYVEVVILPNVNDGAGFLKDRHSILMLPVRDGFSALTVNDAE